MKTGLEMKNHLPFRPRMEDISSLLIPFPLPQTNNIRIFSWSEQMIREKNFGTKPFSGGGRAGGKKLLIHDAESIAVVTGSYHVAEPEKTGEVIVTNFNMNGIEERNRTFSIGKSMDLQDIAGAKGGYFIAGVVSDEGNYQKKDLTIIKILDTPFVREGAVKNSFDLP